MNKLLMILLFGMFFISLASANTYKVDEEFNITVTCLNDGYCSNVSYCNINVANPNGTILVAGENMTYQTSFHSYNITPDTTGAYTVTGYCDDVGETKDVDFQFDVTTTGYPTPTGIPTFMGILLIIIFGIACVFLYLSAIMNEVGFKIFFLLSAVVFLMATMITGYMVSSSANVLGEINTTTLALVVVIGMILIILFIYFLIRLTVNALDMYKIGRGLGITPGYNVGSGSKVAGYNTKRAY